MATHGMARTQNMELMELCQGHTKKNYTFGELNLLEMFIVECVAMSCSACDEIVHYLCGDDHGCDV